MGEHDFSAYQIAEMAMTVEEAGVRFYEMLSILATDGKLKDIFMILSKAEVQHKDIFRSIADSLRNDDPTEYSIDLSSLIETHIDTLKKAAFSMQSFSKVPTNIQDAVEIAINIEKEAIRIYTEMYSTFIEKFHGVLENIINEEKKHLEILTDVKSKLPS